MAKRLFTSESVTEGHPDKICDQISDAVLDAILEKDPNGRVACETTVSTGLVHIMGEITTSCYVDIPKIAREVIRSIGYDRAKYGFDCDTCGIITNIDEQSADIALGVDKSFEAKAEGESELDNGAGDQGMMFASRVLWTICVPTARRRSQSSTTRPASPSASTPWSSPRSTRPRRSWRPSAAI